MFLATDVVGWFVSWQSGAQHVFSYFLAALFPAVAALCMMAVCIASPNVFHGRPFKAPHNVTLPTLYLLIVYAIETLVRYSESGIRQFEEAGRFDQIWLNPVVLVSAWIALVLVLTLVGTFAPSHESVN